MNVVIDTNILNLFLDEKIILLYDNRILTEYITVLKRDKFGFGDEIIDPVIDFIKNVGIFIISEPLIIKIKDEDDKKFIEVAKGGNANYLVTGNTLHFPKEKYIVNPKEFIEQYTKNTNKK